MNANQTWSENELLKGNGSHRWTIHDFPQRAANANVGDELVSSVFEFFVKALDGEAMKLDFQVIVYPNGMQEEHKGHIGVFLRYLSELKADVKYSFLIKGHGTDRKVTRFVGSGTFDQENKGWGTLRAFTVNQLLEKEEGKLPSKGSITIVCSLEVVCFKDKQNSGKAGLDSFDFKTTPSLGDDQLRIVEGLPLPSDFSDVNLVCGSSTFHCHKIMLASRSDVFAAMFSHPDTKEGCSNTVEIEDVEPEILEQLLRFMYADGIDQEKLRGLASKLLIVADKYNVQRLKMICEEKLCNDQDISNAASYFVLAHLHGSQALKEACSKIIKTNLVQVLKTPAFKEIPKGLLKSVMVEMIDKL